MGLEVLYPEPGAAQSDSFSADIVAVHGLSGDPTNTWKHSASDSFWLRDFLPLDVKGARVLNYGYNADVVFGDSTADVNDHAKGLLGCLIDERETDEESKRPLIFIAHSLGGLIVKQALIQAYMEPQYQIVLDHTLGLVFFGTPHRGSGKASYGKILANVATGVMHKPKSKLISVLETKSDTLMSITEGFKYRAQNMKITTFYETKTMPPFKSPIIKKQSALLEWGHEDAQPVDANHRDMCKFDTRNHEIYKKLVSRLNRILKMKDKPLLAPDSSNAKFRNKHFELPFDVTPYFTGGNDVLGGSFIDTSSADMAEQGFSSMARLCNVGDRMDDFKRYLTNSLEPWLLILDNADDPSLDILPFFPVGNRGTIIVTSRNPECRCHATVGSRELREMASDEAINLLLRSGDLDSENQTLRSLAKPIVETLGYLALAVNHAGAYIRQRICSLEDYLGTFTRHRTKLLSSQPVQAGSEYKYTVYTTWDISVESIKKIAKSAKGGTAANALDVLTLFGFCHFDNIMEDMFKSAWDNFTYTKEYPWWESNLLGMVKDRRTSYWDSLLFNETIQLLSNYSLIHINGSNNRISLHPLVHSWIRDSLNEELHLRWWNITISTLALGTPESSAQLRRQLKLHLHHCMGTRQIDDLFIEDDVAFDRAQIVSWISFTYACNPSKDCLTLSERALEYSRRILGDECRSTCWSSYLFALFLNKTSQYQKASDLLQRQLDVTIRIAGLADLVTWLTIHELTSAYIKLGRGQAALELAQKHLALCEKSLDKRDDAYLEALEQVALGYLDVGKYEESIGYFKEALARRKEVSDQENRNVLHLEFHLASAYNRSEKHRDALELFQRTLNKYSRVFGEDDPDTICTMVATAIVYGKLSQPEKGIPLVIKAIHFGSETGLDLESLQSYEKVLEWLQPLRADPPETVHESRSEPESLPDPERERIPSRKKLRFWQMARRPRRGPPS